MEQRDHYNLVFSHPLQIFDPFRDYSESLVFNTVCMYTILHIFTL